MRNSIFLISHLPSSSPLSHPPSTLNISSCSLKCTLYLSSVKLVLYLNVELFFQKSFNQIPRDFLTQNKTNMNEDINRWSWWWMRKSADSSCKWIIPKWLFNTLLLRYIFHVFYVVSIPFLTNQIDLVHQPIFWYHRLINYCIIKKNIFSW